MSPDNDKGEYIVEFQQHGAAVKVSVFDPLTMMEVSIVGPSSVGQAELQRAALAKLHYVMRKKAEIAEAAVTPPSGIQKKPGIIV